MARLLVHTVFSALSFGAGGQDRASTVAELKRMMGGYLLREEGKLER